jgi:hypothetical protein
VPLKFTHATHEALEVVPTGIVMPFDPSRTILIIIP